MNPWVVLTVLLLVLPAVLVACAPAPELPPTEPASVTDWPVAPAAAPAAVNHAPAAAAVATYRAAEAAEAHAVTKPSATADSIGAVQRADKAARAGVAALVRQNGQPTAAVIARARAALEDLIRALETPPQ